METQQPLHGQVRQQKQARQAEAWTPWRRWDDGLARCDSDRFEGMKCIWKKRKLSKNVYQLIHELHFQKRPTKEPCLKNQKFQILFCTSDFGKILKEVEHY